MKFIDAHRDAWHAATGEDGPMPTPDPCAHRLLTLAQWHAVRDHWPQTLPAGVQVPNDVDVETLSVDLPRLGLIALQFPKWVDGRAYSQARLLRSRLRYTGELRATGEVLVDMLPLLARSGFDAVQLRPDQSRAEAERSLAFFAGPDAHYQGDVAVHAPRFGRRAA